MEETERVNVMAEFLKGEAKRFKELVTLIKNVPKSYEQFYVGHTMDMDYIISIHRNDENPVFKLSRFRQIIDKVPSDLRGAIYSTEELYGALKAKPVRYTIELGDYIFIEDDSGKKTKVGKKISLETGQQLIDVWMKDAASWYDLLWRTLGKNPDDVIEETGNSVSRLERQLTEEEIRRLIEYEVVTIRPYVEDDDPARQLAVIATCKLFPKPKSMEYVNVHWLYTEGTEQFIVNLEAGYDMKPSSVVFSNVVTAIKC